jgi:predicted metal-dependent HD superfamily phosphohydrolase
MDLTSLLQHFAIDGQAAQSLFQKTALAYSSKGRFYHTLAHIGQVLKVVNLLNTSGDSLLPGDSYLALNLAAWFHDVVYDPRRDDNEAQSVAWMESALHPLGIPENINRAASNLIMATRSHSASSDDLLSQVLLDADLSILGAPPKIYAQYASAIRQEYAYVPDDAYRVGRRTVLERFSARLQIFSTPFAFANLEKQARANLTEEIHLLSTNFQQKS